jgi:hypothetical protein
MLQMQALINQKAIEAPGTKKQFLNSCTGEPYSLLCKVYTMPLKDNNIDHLKV